MHIDTALAAVVTGGASGLGEATARTLAAKGAKVAIFDRNRDLGEKLAHELGCLFVETDVLSDDSVAAAFLAARQANGQERVLVNCAGGGNAIKTVSRDKKTGEVKRFPSEKFASVLMLNTVGTFRCITHAAEGMVGAEPIDGERGVIIMTASAAAQDGQIGQAAYAASKAAVVGMTLPIARDLSSEGIRVNSIMPGIFDTPLMGAAPPEVKAALAASVPFPKRLGAPEEYASLALEMIRNRYFNGETVRLDGAIRMAPR